MSTIMWVPATAVWSSSIRSMSVIMLLRSMQSRMVNSLLSKQPGRNNIALGPDGEHGFDRIKQTLEMFKASSYRKDLERLEYRPGTDFIKWYPVYLGMYSSRPWKGQYILRYWTFSRMLDRWSGQTRNSCKFPW